MMNEEELKLQKELTRNMSKEIISLANSVLGDIKEENLTNREVVIVSSMASIVSSAIVAIQRKDTTWTKN